MEPLRKRKNQLKQEELKTHSNKMDKEEQLEVEQEVEQEAEQEVEQGVEQEVEQEVMVVLVRVVLVEEKQNIRSKLVLYHKTTRFVYT